MARLNNPNLPIEELLVACGIPQEQMKHIVGATIEMRPGHQVVLHVNYALYEEDIKAVATAVADYELVRTA